MEVKQRGPQSECMRVCVCGERERERWRGGWRVCVCVRMKVRMRARSRVMCHSNKTPVIHVMYTTWLKNTRKNNDRLKLYLLTFEAHWSIFLGKTRTFVSMFYLRFMTFIIFIGWLKRRYMHSKVIHA